MKLSVFLNLTILAVSAFNLRVSADDRTTSFREVKAQEQVGFEAREDCRTWLTTGTYKIYNHERTLQDGLTVIYELTQEIGENGRTKYTRETKINGKKMFLKALEYNYDPVGLSNLNVYTSFPLKSCKKDPESDMVGVDYENNIDDQTLQTIYFEKE